MQLQDYFAAERKRFPATADIAYFMTASTGLIPDYVHEGISAYQEARYRRGGDSRWRDGEDSMAMMYRSKCQMADMLGCGPEDIAFAANTTQALSYFTGNLSITPGDNVVIPDNLFETGRYGSECVRMCLDAGVYTIEHGGGLDSACIEILAKQQAFLIPTLAPNLLIENSTTYSQVAKDRYFNCLANEENISIRQAYQAGLKLGFGTDIDIVELSENMGCEFLARKKYTGMSNRDMLLQATRNNAQILKIDDLTGSVTEGLSADLILVDGDPEQDISVMTHKPLHVFFRGKRLAVQRV